MAIPAFIGSHSIIDLDLSRYDAIATRFAAERDEATSFLKSGIATRNAAFNTMIADIERVAIRSRAPILLTGPTGAGKSQLAQKIYELKKSQRQVSGAFVEVNCATLRGDSAMSTLFGHVRGAFTGAHASGQGSSRRLTRECCSLTKSASSGLTNRQCACVRSRRGGFSPSGRDRDATSDFQLAAGTNRDLGEAVREGRFREDLYARLNLWTFQLPALKDRREDIEPNLEFELKRWSEGEGQNVTFNREARERYLAFALSPHVRLAGEFP